MQTIFLSMKGIKELQQSIIALEQKVTKIQTELRNLGHRDTHDDRLLKVEKLQQIDTISFEIAKKQYMLSHAKRYPRKRDVLKVALGSIVDLLDAQGRIVRYTIVESIEANPSDGRISIISPLGRSLIGKTIQDTIQWGQGLKMHHMQLVAIH